MEDHERARPTSAELTYAASAAFARAICEARLQLDLVPISGRETLAKHAKLAKEEKKIATLGIQFLSLGAGTKPTVLGICTHVRHQSVLAFHLPYLCELGVLCEIILSSREMAK